MDAIEPDPAPADPADDAPPSSRRRPRWPLLLLGIVAVVATAAAVALWADRSDLEADADRRDEIADVAGRFASALLTYDHEDIDASREAVVALATDDFGQEYTDAFGGGLGGQIDALEATSSATVREVFVAESAGDTARVIVIADSEITSNAGRRGTIGTYLDMSLLRIDGRWRVDDVTSVANAGTDLDPVPGSDGDTTSTTTPATTTSAPAAPSDP